MTLMMMMMTMTIIIMIMKLMKARMKKQNNNYIITALTQSTKLLTKPIISATTTAEYDRQVT